MSSFTTVLPVDAAASARAGRLSKTAGYYAAFVALGLFGASMGPTLPGLAQHTQANLSQISYLFTARWLGYLLGSLVGGRLYDRLPGHRVIGGVLILMAVMMGIVPVMSVLWLLTAALLILGVAEGAVDVGGNTMLVWVHREKVGPFMNALHFFFGVGAFIAPIVVAQAIRISGDVTLAYWVLALMMLPAFAWLVRLPSPRAQVVAADGSEGQANRPLVAMIALFFLLHVGAEIGFSGWIYTYAVAKDLANSVTAAYLTSAFFGAFTLGRLLSIPVALRVRPRWVLLGGLIGCLIGLGIILLWQNSLAAIWLGTFVVGLAMAAIFPTTLSFAERHMTITGQVTGWFLAGASLGGMFLPWLIGQLFESIGPQVTMLAILVDMVVALGVFALLLLYLSRSGRSRG